MNVTRAVRSGTRVRLPAGVERPTEVYVNASRRRRAPTTGSRTAASHFTRELQQEGRLGFWRWARSSSAQPARIARTTSSM
jgi:hypothetical protein